MRAKTAISRSVSPVPLAIGPASGGEGKIAHHQRGVAKNSHRERVAFLTEQAMTRRDHYGLKHVPSGDTLDEHGRGEWPRDSFTFRLRDEKAIRLVEDEAETPTPAESRKASGSSAKE